MIVLHVCLASHYTEGMTYQDNLLPLQSALDGHKVVVVSDCFEYKSGELVPTEEEDRILDSGIRLVRMKYVRILNRFLSSKVRKVSGLYMFIESVRPDVILFHGVAGWEMLTVAKYKKNTSGVRLYIDSHEDFHNSGKNWVSRFFQYRIFNRLIVWRVKPFIDKFLYLSYESSHFLQAMYGLREPELEFYPLGGQVITYEEKKKFSKEIRERHLLSEEDIIIVHSGKLEPGKRTEHIIHAFSSVAADRLKLLIVGSIPSDQLATLHPLIDADPRIVFAGWKPAEELIKYLSSANLYFQPGTQSATMQNAICCGAPVALYPYPSHEPYVKGNGFWVKETADFITVFERIAANPALLNDMSECSFELARSLLDYKILAARLYI
jgi:glycosyltransferase involved in cell wall biosynthesis